MDFSERGLRPQSSHVLLSDYSAGPASQWTTSVPASPSAHFKEGDRVVLHEDLRDNEHFDPLFFASAEDEVVTGVVLFALPPRGSEEQRCVLVARERDCSVRAALLTLVRLVLSLILEASATGFKETFLSYVLNQEHTLCTLRLLWFTAPVAWSSLRTLSEILW